MFTCFCFVVSLASPLIVVEELSQNTLTVTLTVQTICRAVDHTLVVCFGQRKMGSDEECDFSGGVSLREDGVQLGAPHTFTVNESVLSLSSGQQYCYTASLLRRSAVVSVHRELVSLLLVSFQLLLTEQIRFLLVLLLALV